VRVTIAAVGRLKPGPERDLFDRYKERSDKAGRQVGIGPVGLIEIPESPHGSARQRREAEAEALLKKIPPDSLLVALDETGKSRTSRNFAKLVEASRDQGTSEIVFAIGGADGHGASLRERANEKLALGTLTLPHGLARIMLAEQIYRAITILSGHPYHRD
jgi:23S rRNA (pseudouridine1915-N3)-methyltransferase